VTKLDINQQNIDRDLIVDRIYQIALEPSSLEEFIDYWHHLDRAQSILQHSETSRSDFTAYLQPYDNLAAFIVSDSLLVEASNQGAFSAFGVKPGDRLDAISVPLEMRHALLKATQEVLRKSKSTERLIKAEMAAKCGTVLFRIMRIAKSTEGEQAALVVSSRFYWRDSIGVLLGNVFHLTQAEQDVVRLLVEGKNTKAIATTRNTSEGTARGQIKSIIGKMNLSSQTDIVRLVMTLGDFPKSSDNDNNTVELAVPELSNNWLETEVWKPFKSITVNDGRTLTYHDMGPASGNPILFSHLGSCMVRWPRSMISLAFEHNLRIICPIRAGFGQSDSLKIGTNIFESIRNDTVYLLACLGITKLPYAVQGSDFPFAVDLISKHPEMVSELISVGGRPCLPGGTSVDGEGRWQRFFVSMAQRAPHMVQFASMALMAMSRRIGPEAMLRQLCKDSPADLALLNTEEMKQILVANINLMAAESTNAAGAFAMEYIAFQEDWSDCVMTTQTMPVRIFLADEDPTVDLHAIPKLQEAYPWINIEVVQNAGLALMYQQFDVLIPLMADAAKDATQSPSVNLVAPRT